MCPMISIPLALLAGILTVAAPCILPVLPVLLGASLARHGKAWPIFLTVGFLASFAVITLIFSLFSQLLGIEPDTLRTAAIVLLTFFGVLMLWPQLYQRISYAAVSLIQRDNAAASYQGATSGFLMGATIGLVWTPCAGPVLGSILTLLATQMQIEWAALLLLLYAVGASVPILAIAYGGQYAAARARAIAPYTQSLQRIFGVLVIGSAAAMYFQYDAIITAWLSGLYPNGQIGL